MMISNSSPVKNMMNQDAVQSVVHDLRTPMTVIKGNLQLLLSGVMGQMTEEQLMLIQRSVGPLEDLILLTENLLQAATLEKSELTLKPEATDLDKLLSDTINFYVAPFQQREMQIYRDGNTFGTKLHVDPVWMKRVLNNLIWNAYKFTPDHGKVIIHVTHKDDGMELIVQDNGRGIAANQMKSVFEKYKQASPARDRKLGNGLGLWICKRVLELHGGSIRVESEEGKGSRFILSIPSSCIL
jgi:two-component system, OmpR family, phosphate regulon sensor histidine kinase PhoR